MKPGEREFDDLTLRVLPGSGVVHRSRGAVLVMPSVTASQSEAAAKLLGYCSSSTDPTGRRLFRRVAGLLAQSEPESVPPLCLLVETLGEVAVLAHGPVSAVATGQREQRVSGADSLAWVEERIEGPLSSVLVVGDHSPAADETPALPFDLQSGTVPGGGIVLSADGPLPAPLEAASVESQRPAAPPSPAQPAPQPGSAQADGEPVAARPRREAAPAETEHESHAFESVLLLESASPEARRPLPVTPEQGAEHVTDEPGSRDFDEPPPSLVEGALCSRGHFNEPDAAYCSVCGISMLQRTRDTVLRPRPSLGVLVLDDGSAYTITSPYVLGREPETDDAVAAGRARPLVLDDDSHSVSRVHARLTLEGWNVLLTDLGSSNGTYLSTNGENGPWTALEPNVPTRLGRRTRVRLGRRELVFDSYHAKAPVP